MRPHPLGSSSDRPGRKSQNASGSIPHTTCRTEQRAFPKSSLTLTSAHLDRAFGSLPCDSRVFKNLLGLATRMHDGKTPKLLVLIPKRNGMKYLPYAIDSILSQEFRDFELIVSDNYSTMEQRNTKFHFG